MRKFHRIKNRRKLFVNNLIHHFVMRGRMQTTVTRAKEIRPKTEKLVTLAKRQNTHSLRLLMRTLPKGSAEKLYYDIAPKYKERPGGYIRITQLGKSRKRDAAPLARIEFVS